MPILTPAPAGSTAQSGGHENSSERSQNLELAVIRSLAHSKKQPKLPSALVEAMFAARAQSGLSERWEGRAGFEQFAEPGVSGRFAEDWKTMQSILSPKATFLLHAPQLEAFAQQQNQTKELVLIGIRMAEAMIQSAGE